MKNPSTHTNGNHPVPPGRKGNTTNSKNDNLLYKNFGTIDFARLYLKNGLTVIPVEYKTKQPVKGLDLDKYWNSENTTEEIEEWYKDGSNNGIGIVIKPPLIGIDTDEPSMWGVLYPSVSPEELSQRTWVTKTPHGYHTFIVCTDEGIKDRKPIFVFNSKNEKVFEVYFNKRYFIEPPSINENGKEYLAIGDRIHTGIETIDSETANKFIKELELYSKFYPIINLIKPFWKESTRHTAAMSLGGAMRKANVELDDSLWVIRAICRATGDNEVKDRENVIQDTYSKPINEIQGYSGLKELFGEDVANTIAKRLANNSDDERKYLEFNKEGNVVNIKKDLLVNDLLSDYIFLTFEDSKDILYYDEGVYKFGGAEIISQECERRIPIKYAAKFLSRYEINEIIGHIERKTYVDRSEFDTGNHNLLIVDNGVIDFGTWNFKEHSPDIKALNKLLIKYDSNADCPQIKKFISGVISPDEIPLMQEFIGYILYPDLPTHKSMWWHGGGRNGKDTLATLVTKLIGIDNVSYVDLHDLEMDRFAPASLYGKLLNISGEVNPAALNRMNIFKAITGGTEIEAQKKYGHRFKFKYRGKIIIFGNQIPLINENTVAFDERIILIRFPNRFLDNDPRTIKGLSEIISTPEEMSGFLNWTLDGLKRLKNNNWIFSTSKSSEEMKEEFTRQSNPIRAFINERTEIEIDAVTTSEELYNSYKAFCEENDLKVRTLTAFGTEIRKIPHVIRDRDKKTRATIYKNIAVIDNTRQSCQSFSLYNYSDDNIHHSDVAYDNGIENYVNPVNPVKNIDQLCEQVFNVFVTRKKEDGEGVLSFSELCLLLHETDKKEIKSALKLLEHLNKIAYLRSDSGWATSDGVDLNAWFKIKGGE